MSLSSTSTRQNILPTGHSPLGTSLSFIEFPNCLGEGLLAHTIYMDIVSVMFREIIYLTCQDDIIG